MTTINMTPEQKAEPVWGSAAADHFDDQEYLTKAQQESLVEAVDGAKTPREAAEAVFEKLRQVEALVNRRHSVGPVLCSPDARRDDELGRFWHIEWEGGPVYWAYSLSLNGDWGFAAAHDVDTVSFIPDAALDNFRRAAAIMRGESSDTGE